MIAGAGAETAAKGERGKRDEDREEADLQDGEGVESWADGSLYEGQYAAGMKHGQGAYSLVFVTFFAEEAPAQRSQQNQCRRTWGLAISSHHLGNSVTLWLLFKGSMRLL